MGDDNKELRDAHTDASDRYETAEQRRLVECLRLSLKRSVEVCGALFMGVAGAHDF